MRTAAGLHDIGKILIPAKILEAPRKLTAQERELISNHACYGGHLLRRADAPEAVIHAADLHHHRFDGRGSDPDEPRGMALPSIARLLMLADSLEAKTSPLRTCRRPLDEAEAMAEVLRGAGGQFDPVLADALPGRSRTRGALLPTLICDAWCTHHAPHWPLRPL